MRRFFLPVKPRKEGQSTLSERSDFGFTLSAKARKYLAEIKLSLYLTRATDREGYFDFRFRFFNYSAPKPMLWVLI